MTCEIPAVVAIQDYKKPIAAASGDGSEENLAPGDVQPQFVPRQPAASAGAVPLDPEQRWQNPDAHRPAAADRPFCTDPIDNIGLGS
jgi:hypothetical protein